MADPHLKSLSLTSFLAFHASSSWEPFTPALTLVLALPPGKLDPDRSTLLRLLIEESNSQLAGFVLNAWLLETSWGSARCQHTGEDRELVKAVA